MPASIASDEQPEREDEIVGEKPVYYPT